MLTAAEKMVYKISIPYYPQSSVHIPVSSLPPSQLCHYSYLWDQAVKPTIDLTSIRRLFVGDGP